MTKPTWTRGDDDDTAIKISMPDTPPEHTLDFLAGCSGQERVARLKRTYFQAFDAAAAQDAALAGSAGNYDRDLPPCAAATNASKKRKDSLQDNGSTPQGSQSKGLSAPTPSSIAPSPTESQDETPAIIDTLLDDGSTPERSKDKSLSTPTTSPNVSSPAEPQNQTSSIIDSLRGDGSTPRKNKPKSSSTPKTSPNVSSPAGPKGPPPAISDNLQDDGNAPESSQNEGSSTAGPSHHVTAPDIPQDQVDQTPAIIVSTENPTPSEESNIEVPKELRIDGNAGFDPHRTSNEPETIKTYLWHGKRYQVQGDEPKEWLVDVKEVPKPSSPTKGTERSVRRKTRSSKTPTSNPSKKSSRVRKSSCEGSSRPEKAQRKKSGRARRSTAATQQVLQNDVVQHDE